MQAMYSLEDEDDPESDLVLDDPIEDGFEDGDDGELLNRWLVAPEHSRPWLPFGESPSSERGNAWPLHTPADLSVGAPAALS